MKIKLKKLNPHAVIPTYAISGDAAMDLTAISIVKDTYYYEYGTGLAVSIPEGFVGLIYPRSSITNKGLILGNSVGVIDSGYRSEIKLRFYTSDKYSKIYDVGDRIGQLMIIPHPIIEFELVDELSQSIRNNGGFGSTN
jgi:dUTP pyrophosphatase